MDRLVASSVVAAVFLITACSRGPEGDERRASSSSSTGSGGVTGAGGAGGAGGTGGGASDAGAGEGGGSGAEGGADCSVDGNPGTCLEVSACAAMTGYSSTPGYCPGAADIQCCAPTPNTADNPPTPAGYELMDQSEVTAAMTAWAVAILDDPTAYPMFATTTMTFGTQLVLALVEWHPPDFQNDVVHRGVTLFVPI